MQWDIIPQVSNDLIARVIPGGVTLFLGYCVFTGPAKALDSILRIAPEEGVRRFPSLFLWLVLSYVVGRLLGELWEVFSRMAEWCHRRLWPGMKAKSLWKRRGNGTTGKPEKTMVEAEESWDDRLREYSTLAALLGHHESLPAARTLPDRYVLHDHLRLYAPSDAFRLLKIHAEEKMLRSLAVGLTMLLVIGFWYWWWTSRITSDRVLLAMGLLISMLCSWVGARKCNRHHLVAIQRAWLFHNYPVGAAARASGIGGEPTGADNAGKTT